MFCRKFELFAALYDDSCEPQFFTHVFSAENFVRSFGALLGKMNLLEEKLNPNRKARTGSVRGTKSRPFSFGSDQISRGNSSGTLSFGACKCILASQCRGFGSWDAETRGFLKE